MGIIVATLYSSESLKGTKEKKMEDICITVNNKKKKFCREENDRCWENDGIAVVINW